MQFTSKLAQLSALAAVLVSSVAAHGNIISYVIDGVTYPAWAPYGPTSQPGTINRPFYQNGPATPFESGVSILCNGNNLAATTSAPVTAGSTIHTVWTSVHPGPVMGYLASCNGPCSSFFGDGPWVKFQQDGYDPTNATPWAEERLRAASAWDFVLPKNLPDGEYLLRTEILGLHAASNLKGAQFYPSCAHLVVSGGEPGPFPSAQGIAIDGAYQDTDPGILVALYTITPQNPAYTAPGGPVIPFPTAGPGGPSSSSTSTSHTSTSTSSSSTSTSKSTTTTTTTSKSSTTSSTTTKTSSSAGPTQTKYGQCGGQGWAGPTTCAAGSTCTASNAYYSQCL
ncbi:hypothetical protein SISNIDRAFT_498210 [Sistotremastrum niveocremeum HHB9708]|uniref:lytic cellulose monooxygenase (C4-dehydrogenating) n=1 Tax=Sistotremastrum niveocremeum HHB9708 TaxID=1314777 RepID=A0A164NQ09_9AGAM|nr:hypothetical protein SISNIDRAFT_498210 [Sistotremastrum niveocremeum HHB9708]